ncbi:MAG TPA: DNA polymerase IV [Streptosporangiaceae bacterium]|nr:DNA polymerase IV [Streptosporangiaceae bacterium]
MTHDAGCHVLHADMDAFFASVEVRDRPELRGKPVIVAGGGRGVVLSATYEARAYGVRSAMPTARALRLCPRAVLVPPRRGEYAAASRDIMRIFRAVTPLVEPLSLDEAFLDVSGALRRLGPPASIAAMIRAQVHEQHGITCSVGVAPSKFIAKLASARCKPDGLLVVPAADVLTFLHPLPVEALWGVGERAAQALARLGLRTVGDLAQTPAATLRREFGDAAGSHLARLAWAEDNRAVVPHTPEKSIGAEETFPADVTDPAVIRRELLRLSERTARSLRSSGYAARTIVVKLRLASFATITRSRTLPEPTDVAHQIHATACALYESAGLDARASLRLVGVRAANLVATAAGAGTQLALGDRVSGWPEAERAMDKIAARFGPGAVGPAALVEADATEVRDGGDDSYARGGGS